MLRDTILQGFRNPPNSYRPVPFWSWNERLDTDETRRQIAEMEKVGIGGYFMHARGGLQTEYMSDDWMDNIHAGIDEARKRDMEAWAYDENGWPSGFGDGLVNGKGEVFQQKYLRCESCSGKQNRDDGRTIANVEQPDGTSLHFYYDVNPFYVDTLDRVVIKDFLVTIYQPYLERFRADFGDAMPGFFTDEPQVSRNGIPWSLILPDAYRSAYGEDLLPLLPELFSARGNYKRTRYRFWHLVQELFVTAFSQQIYDWCEANGARLTGHMVLEETLLSQITSNGAVMPHYEFFHMPGMDWLGRHIDPITTPLQVSSVANQLGHKHVLSETFALTGWNVAFEELRWMYEWQMVRGVTRLCQHLEGYSLRGIRKRDYPPSLFYQQPWWEDYRKFNDLVSRIGFLLAEGKPDPQVLVVHPQASAWLCFDNAENAGIHELFRGFVDVSTALEACHAPFHYGDERIIRRHGKVDGACLHVGLQEYAVVVVPPCETLAKSTVSLLQIFADQGGRIIWTGHQPELTDGEKNTALTALTKCGTALGSPAELETALPPHIRQVSIEMDDDVPTTTIQFTSRLFESDGNTAPSRLLYFVNKNREKPIVTKLKFPAASAVILDAETGELQPCGVQETSTGMALVEHTFPPCGSLLILCSEQPIGCVQPQSSASQGKPLPLKQTAGMWDLELRDPNTITLDTCDYWFDGILQEKNAHISVLQHRALAESRPITIRMCFSVDTVEGYTPSKDCHLVIETPHIFTITVNGREVSSDDVGYYRDTSFRKLPVGSFLQSGRNDIVLETLFRQSNEVYAHLKRSEKFEAEKNKLTYDMELETIYLTGDFGVMATGPHDDLPRDATRCSGPFVIGPIPRQVSPDNLVTQGLPFFNGDLVMRKTVNMSEYELTGRCIALARVFAHVARVRVNGREVAHWMWRPFDTGPLPNGLLVQGENTIELELTAGLRNLLGPHHLQEGESYAVAPRSFFKEPNIWGNQPWDDGYCFVRLGVEFC